jgi:predicted permease
MVNVVNLLVVRASGRSKELAVRQVLGAGRLNLAIQFIGETTLLNFIGGLFGLGLGALGLRAIARIGIDHLPLGEDVALTMPVALSALGASILVGVLLAVPLVILSMRTDLARALTIESRSGTTTRSTHRLRHSLIVAQIALAFVLLANAGLLGLSFKKVLSVQPGFRPDSVITAWVGLPWKGYSDGATRIAFANRWLEALHTLPGVTAAGIGTTLPVVGELGNLAMLIDGRPPAPGEAARAHHLGAATGDYFTAFGIPLHEGRLINADDSQAEKPVCVVDDVFARHYWPDGTALGHRISIGTEDAGKDALTVVGVVGSVKQLGLNETDPMGMLYYPLRKDSAPFRFVAVVRTQQDPSSLAPSMRQELQRIDPALPLDDVKPMTVRIEETLLLPRSLMLLASIFAGIALLLAAIGVYGVLAYAIAQRKREIGVRLALGAMPIHILCQFLRLGATLLLIGTSLGLTGGWFMARAMTSLLFGISPGNPFVFAGTAALLGLVVLLASVLPARRASAVSVMEALRAD